MHWAPMQTAVDGHSSAQPSAGKPTWIALKLLAGRLPDQISRMCRHMSINCLLIPLVITCFSPVGLLAQSN